MAKGTSMRGRGRRVATTALVVALLAACSDDGASSPTSSAPPSTADPAPTGPTDRPTTGPSVPSGASDGPGVALIPASALRLSEGEAPVSADPVTSVTGEPLDAAAVAAVVDRLPEWTVDTSLAEPFAWPAQTRPVPIAGTVVDVPFPDPAAGQADPTEPQPASGPLQVLRSQPDGDVSMAPFVSITFDQPMVPVGTVGQVAGSDVPATITPPIAGRWQWIGTRTLRFDADPDPARSVDDGDLDRLPMATEYRLVVPAGTESATGGVLADDVVVEFRTPPPSVQSFGPHGDVSLGLTPVFVAHFDQRVDPAAVLAAVTVRADGELRDVRLATAAEVADDPFAAGASSGWPEGRSVAFRPVDPLPTDADLDIAIGPDVPSAEGPRTGDQVARFDARTYAALAVERVSCGGGQECPPGAGIEVVLNNVLDALAFDPAAVRIDPAIPGGAEIGVHGSVVSIWGATEPLTTYTVTLPAALTDVHGQQLGQDVARTVRFGAAEPMLRQIHRPIVTLDPSSPSPTLSVASAGHEQLRLRAYAVEPADWAAFVEWAFERADGRAGPTPPFPALVDRTVGVQGGDAGRMVETPIDLADALAGRRHAVVQIETTESYGEGTEQWWMNRPIVTWVQSTSLGVDVFTDHRELRAWVTDLESGAPVAGAAVTMTDRRTSTTTDEDGLASLQLGPAGTRALVVAAGDDLALAPSDAWESGWAASPQSDEARFHVFDDRSIYRPGETVSVKGWVRRLTTSGAAQLVPIGGDGARVTWVARDAQGAEIAEGQAPLSAAGGFDLAVAIPAGANLGPAWLEFALAGVDLVPLGGAHHEFRIEEFRRPDFEVDAHRTDAEPAVVGEPLTVGVEADYYAGGPLAAAPVDWQVTTSPATYAPPGWDRFTFGRFVPWWWEGAPGAHGHRGAATDVASDGSEPCCWPPDEAGSEVATFSGTTSAAGEHHLRIDVPRLDGELAEQPVTVTAQATVTNVDRQAISSAANVLVHPSDLYVGLAGERTFVRQGEPLEVEVIVTDVDGAVVAGVPVSVTASRSASTFRDGEWHEERRDLQRCAVTSTDAPVRCTFETPAGGTWTVAADVEDASGRGNHTELTRWVSGADLVPVRDVAEEELTIVPDAREYEPGTTAELLVQSPIAEGEGLAVVARHGIESTIRFTVTGGSAVVPVPIASDDVPNLDVLVEVVGATPRTADDGSPLEGAPARPAFATGRITVPVSLASRTLDVDVTPAAAQVEPGAATVVDVVVTDATGAPVVGAELAVVVVDEAVLALTGHRTPDPLATFYAQLPTYLSSTFGRSSIVLTRPEDLAGGATDGADERAAGEAAPAPPGSQSAADMDVAEQAANGGGAASATPQGGGAIGVRTDFDALAVFEPAVVTDASGAARVEVPLPDNLTRYRVMVVAAAGADRFGSADDTITAQLPLMVRPSAPRFLNVGDVFELPVVVQNQTDAAMQVDVVVQADNLALTGASGLRVEVPANDRVEVRFPAAAVSPGTARFRVAAVDGAASDAAEAELPVHTPATAEAFATYGVIDGDTGVAAQPIVAPTDVLAEFGGLEVTTSSTALHALSDAVLDLHDHPYESADAFATRILAVASLRDVLDAFDAEGLPPPAQLAAQVQSDVDRLLARQHGDGGFGWWRSGGPSDPFVSVEAAHALVVAREQGFSVDQAAIELALGYAHEIESHLDRAWSEETRATITAYALHVRAVAGDRDADAAEALHERLGDRLPLDAAAWIWPVVDDAQVAGDLERTIRNRAVDTAGAVTFTTDASDDGHLVLRSDRRTDAIVLQALITQQPTSDLVPKVVAGLLGGRRAGAWDGIQESSAILLALHRYFEVYESEDPAFVARVWLAGRYAGNHEFTGRSTDRASTAVPTAALIDALGATGQGDVVIQRDGTGRLYYRIAMRTAPSDLRLDPLDRGFVVARTYEAVDDPGDVARDPDGTWRIRAGARVRVRLTMVAESQRTHAALVDPLPAGFEILNPALATTGELPEDPEVGPGAGDARADASWPRWWTWFEHQNLRDDRAEAFASTLPAGTYDYSYVATATTPGTFVVPPVRAEEVYAPETFGRGATDTVVIG